MLYRNNFPEYLQSIAIGPNSSFISKNTTNCEFVSAFPQEIELMYDLKSLKKSSDPLNALRDFSKKVLIYGPDLDVQCLFFFGENYNRFPSYYTDTINAEINDAFNRASKINNPNCLNAFITPRTALNVDLNFLNKLACLLRSCSKPCNYFKKYSDSVGILSDFQRGLSESSNMLSDVLSDAIHAPLNVATTVYNKIVPAFRTEFTKLKIATEQLFKDGVAPFFSEKQKARTKSTVMRGGSVDLYTPENRLLLTGDTKTYHSVSKINSEVVLNIQNKMNDCFRMHDFKTRYNAYDPTMNVAFAKRTFIGLKNSDVSSLIDITGSLAPSQYATDNTYRKSLSVDRSDNMFKYDDSPTRKLYDSYNDASGIASSTITGGLNSDDIQIPTNGKIYEFDYGKVKLTRYGYIKDESPDVGTEIGLGNVGNMIVPLKTIAVAPELLDRGLVKVGDVLIIKATDKSGNTFIERRQVGDRSGYGLLGNTYEFLIDEFQPDKTLYPSKLAGRTTELKITIQVADQKQPLPKWNAQEASQFAPMFLNRSDWERVKAKGGTTYQKWVNKMDTDYIKYVKWNESDPVDYKFVNS